MTAIPSPVLLLPPDDTLIVPLVGNPIGLWDGLRATYLDHRPATRDPATGTTYPETTGRDVEQIVATWARVIGRDYQAERDAAGALDRWDAYLKALGATVAARARGDRYPDNRDLWLVHSLGLARALSAMYEPATTAAQFAQSAPGLAKDVARAALGVGGLELAADAAKSVSHSLGAAGSALASGAWHVVKVPLLIGAGVLGAVILVPRLLPPRREVDHGAR